MRYYEWLYLMADKESLFCQKQSKTSSFKVPLPDNQTAEMSVKMDVSVYNNRLGDCLLFQIYSPTVIRQAYLPWPTLPKYLRDNTPEDIVKLIEQSPYLSDKALKEKLNERAISLAVQTLEKYKSCDVPFTQDIKVPQQRVKLTSRAGDEALLILKNALANKQYTDKMAHLALCTSHKFLFDSKYYLPLYITKSTADALTLPMRKKKKGPILAYKFPVIQLTKGCQNHCSHCDSRAEPHLSHMPWPIFVAWYRGLNKYYRHYPQKECDHYFSQFFADSDMLDYDEPVMNVDSGDVGLWIAEEKAAHCQYLTRGVKNAKNKLALAKALVSGCSIAISFVDTPKENMPHNIEQLNETLDVVESVSGRRGNPPILHLHLKSGPTVDKKLFRNFPLEQKVIYALGRAKELPYKEVNHFPDDTFWAPCVIRPNGDIVKQTVENGELSLKTYQNIYRKQQECGPKINRVRLLWRRCLSKIK